MTRTWFAVALLAVAGFASNAYANAIPIYSTGQGTTGHADPNWVIASSPSSSTPTTAYDVTSKAAGWANQTGSTWISPNKNGTVYSPVGNYDYQTTFNMAGLNLSTALLTGSIASDDCLVEVLLNGHAISGIGMGTGVSNTACGNSHSYATFTGFTINSGFLAGVNTLTFVIENAHVNPNPTGMNLRIGGTALPLPEPASLGMFGLGLLGLGGLWLRRRV